MEKTRASTKTVGDFGERLAADYLERKGYSILVRNFRYGRAEIDLVCERGRGINRQLTFVEVKTRHGPHFGRPEEAVDARKRNNLFRAAEGYLLQNRMMDVAARFDVIAIDVRCGLYRIRHIMDAFS